MSEVALFFFLLQPSWFVQLLLFQLCVEVNRVGGHALPRPTLQELLQTCLAQALNHFHGLTQQNHSKVTDLRWKRHIVGKSRKEEIR